MTERKKGKEEPEESPVGKIRSILDRSEKITKEELEDMGWQRVTSENPPGGIHRFRYGTFGIFWNQRTEKIRDIYEIM